METKSIIRFQDGRTYRLRTSPDFPRDLAGTLIVREEITPPDSYGNRILLVDCELQAQDGNPDASGNRTSARAFVELTGADEGMEECATIQGTYPYFAKAYASDECIDAQTTNAA